MENKITFAKYLPVGGEIEPGDKVKHNGNIVTAIKKEVAGDTQKGDTWKTDGFPANGSNVQKVKLFLCSRNIEPGDKGVYSYTWKHGYLIGKIEDAHFEKLLPNGRAWLVWPKGTASCEYPFVDNLEEDMFGFTSEHFKKLNEILTPGILEGQEFTKKQTEYLTLK